MKQICAKCMSTDVEMITDGRSSDRIEHYICRVCEEMFYAKRPTKRVGQKERGRLEYLDKMAGLAMQGFIACQARPIALDKEELAQWAYEMSKAMWVEKEKMGCMC